VPTVGIVSPGAMGGALGAGLLEGGARVLATLAGRSPRTERLAQAAGLELVPDLAAVVSESEIVLSVAPPAQALAVAADVAAAARAVGARPLLVDLNATSPQSARRIEAAAAEDGLELVDGSISGPPPRGAGGATRVYLSGTRAEEVAALPFRGVATVVVRDEVGSASAVKMSTASVYKGSAALLAHALLAARRYGVLDHVLADLAAGAPALVERVEARLASATAKSARYVGEMREIAEAQEGAGLTPALFQAMAEVYSALGASPLARTAPEDLPRGASLEQVLAGLGS
jgi:3-hydroxyisobutyrate dehydrogenase-like beta-hydroxyacid dehydrogenase